MANYLITGTSRGIGLELTKQLLGASASQVGKVFATSRGAPSPPLRQVLDKHPDRAAHVNLSVDNNESVQNAVKEVKVKLNGQGLDVLVNNAGASAYTPGGTRSVQPEQLQQTFEVNVVGPQRVTAAFLPLLEAGKQKKVINVSTTLGSMSQAENFKQIPTQAYKISKAALSMLNQQYAMDHADDGFTFLLVSPGWLKTDLGTDYADLDVEVGVKELKRIIFESTNAQNGKFLNIHVPGLEKEKGYDGGEIAW